MSGLELAKNWLEIQYCSTKIETVTCEVAEVEQLIQQKFQGTRAVFVAWQIQNIIWGTFDGDTIFSRADFTPELWLECRIFNEASELHLKRFNGVLRGRYIIDSQGGEIGVVDSFARFWGINSGASEGFIKLLDRQRKLSMKIPCENKNSKWYGLLTRNYISSDESTGLCGYSDYRFVAIQPAEEGVQIG